MSAQRHILIASDNDSLANALRDEMSEAGHAVTRVATAAEVAALVGKPVAGIDLLLLGAHLADGDAAGLIARLRRRGAVLPILVICASAREDDIVAALDAGADDCLVQPLRPREVMARLRVQLRSAANRREAELQIGRATYHPGTRTLTHPDLPRPTRLTEKEAALLQRLYRAEGRPVPRHTLLREVWGYSPEAASHTVETHIYRLRRKLEPIDTIPSLLVNESGGYRLRLTTDAPERPHLVAEQPGWVPLRRAAPVRQVRPRDAA